MSQRIYDVIIIGGGPAGLSAGLMLGRCRRSVLIIDHGRPRNASSHALHGFLTRDGIAPAELLRLGREQLQRYPTIEFKSGAVLDAFCRAAQFNVELAAGERLFSRKLVLATGVIDELPKVGKIAEFYGRGVYHCPYCDGWENRDRHLVAYGAENSGRELALKLTTWSPHVTLCSDGPAGLPSDDRALLVQNGIEIHEERLCALEGEFGELRRLKFEDSSSIPCDAFFFTTSQAQHSKLAKRLGCEFDEKGQVRTGKYETTCVPGLYVCGDASGSMQLVVVAAAEGTQAACAINAELQEADRR